MHWHLIFIHILCRSLGKLIFNPCITSFNNVYIILCISVIIRSCFLYYMLFKHFFFNISSIKYVLIVKLKTIDIIIIRYQINIVDFERLMRQTVKHFVESGKNSDYKKRWSINSFIYVQKHDVLYHTYSNVF